jgi:hypothetical protein
MSTACLYAYGLPLQPASTPTACLYSLPLCVWPASMPTACLSHLHHITVIIIIVHSLIKQNVYLSLLCDLYVFFPLSSFLKLFFFLFFF